MIRKHIHLYHGHYYCIWKKMYERKQLLKHIRILQVKKKYENHISHNMVTDPKNNDHHIFHHKVILNRCKIKL